MRAQLIFSLAGLAALGLSVGVWWFAAERGAPAGQSGSAEWPTAAGERLPDVALADYEGATVRLADFAGQPLVVNSWAAWCPFCGQELADFAAVQKELSRDEEGSSVVFVAVNRAEPREVAQGFTDQLGISQDLVFLLDPSDSFYQAMGGFSMPETLFVDKDGNIIEHKRGPMDRQEILERVRKIL